MSIYTLYTPVTKKLVSIEAAIKDPNLFARQLGNLKTWASWITFTKVLQGLPLRKDELELYRKVTGRNVPPSEPLQEVFLIIGRRAGKSRILSLIAAWLATLVDWRPYLAPGEWGTILVIAQDRAAARTMLNYIKGFLKDSPLLSERILPGPGGETSTSISLRNAIRIEIHTASFRAVRSYTVIGALLDEAAFWRDENSANPDAEVLKAIRPSMATVPGSLLLCASSPFVKRGIVFQAYKEYWGKDDDEVLVWNADTMTMNPTMSAKFVKRRYERDPTSAKTEFGAQFRDDLEMPITEKMIEDCTRAGTIEVPYQQGMQYVAFVDPSGGAQDSFTAAVAHFDPPSGCCVLDAVREFKPPFSPDPIVKDISAFLNGYKLAWCWGDAYGGQWPVERFATNHVSYQVSPKSKSDLYHELIPMLNSKRVELLDLEIIKNQFSNIERRPSRTGRLAYDHHPKVHDDVANVVAGALVMAQGLQPVDFQDHVIVGNELQSAHSDFVDDELGRFSTQREEFGKW